MLRVAALATLLTVACNSSKTSSGSASGVGPIGIDHPRADSDFWSSYIKYVPKFAKELGINLMTPTNSENKVDKLVANAQALQSQGAKVIVMAPQDTGAIISTLQRLEQQNIPVITVDTRPDRGKVY